MATYDEIVANATWFRGQINAVDERIDPCIGLEFLTGCMHLPDEEWPDALAEFRAKYDECCDKISEDPQVGYATGVKQLRKISTGLSATARDYLRTEAAAESEISDKILALLNDF